MGGGSYGYGSQAGYGAQTGGNMYRGMAGKSQSQMNPSMYGAQTGGNMAQTGGNMLGAQTGGNMAPTSAAPNGYAPAGAYGPRWATWQGPLPGAPGVYAPPMNTDITPWGGGQSPFAPGGSPGLPDPRGGPTTIPRQYQPSPTTPGTLPQLPTAGGGALPRAAVTPQSMAITPDQQMASFRSLYNEDPRLAYGYSFGTNSQPWFVQNQGVLRDSMFGGNQTALNQFINNASYANPLSLAERERVQRMAGY